MLKVSPDRTSVSWIFFHAAVVFVSLATPSLLVDVDVVLVQPAKRRLRPKRAIILIGRCMLGRGASRLIKVLRT